MRRDQGAVYRRFNERGGPYAPTMSRRTRSSITSRVGALVAGFQPQLRIFGNFIRPIYAYEVLDLAGDRAAIQAFRIARDAFGQRRIDEDLYEFAIIEQFAHHVALCMKRRDERAQHDQSGLGHQFGDLANTANVLDPVRVCKAEILVQAMPHVVAVEQHRVSAARVQAGLDQIGHRRFAGARQAGDTAACRRHPKARIAAQLLRSRCRLSGYILAYREC